MNLTGRLISQDFTTVADVKNMMQPTGTQPSSMDTWLGEVITSVSRELTDYLGWHALQVERTEIYRTRVHKRVITLDAKNIDTDATFVLKLNHHGKDWAETTETDSDLYHVHQAAGYILLTYPITHVHGFAQVQYTGGWGTTTAELKVNYPDLAQACVTQVKYLADRRVSLGGDVQTTPGTGTSFGSQYNLLTSVKRTLERHRKREV